MSSPRSTPDFKDEAVRQIVSRNTSVLAVFVLGLSCQAIAQEASQEVEPRYPMGPICRDDIGQVALSFYISEDGEPHSIEVVEASNKRFVRQAIRALEEHRYVIGSFSTEELYSKTFVFEPEHQCHKGA